jgi:hypothetical protein
VLGLIALFVALGGTALAATGQLVNIADKTNAANIAKVDAAGKLYVGDGSGPVTVDGTTTGAEAPANTLYHGLAFPSSSGDCTPLATPPTGKALIIKSVALDTVIIGTPGSGVFAGFYLGTSGCESLVLEINPSGVGLINQPFEPGLAVPAGKRLWVATHNISSDVYTYGYTVASSAVPASAAVAQMPAQTSAQDRPRQR